MEPQVRVPLRRPEDLRRAMAIDGRTSTAYLLRVSSITSPSALIAFRATVASVAS